MSEDKAQTDSNGMNLPQAVPSGKATGYENRNLLLLTALAVMGGLQILIIVAFIYSFFPIDAADYIATYLGGERISVVPEREMFFYRIFVLSTIALQALIILIFRRRLGQKELFEKLARFAVAEILLLAIISFSLFKMAVYGPSVLVKALFYIFLCASIITKILWLEIDALSQHFGVWLQNYQGSRLMIRILDGLIPLFIFVTLYIPDKAGAAAKIFVLDSFWHVNSFFMAPGWAALKGCRLNVDAWSQYGVGMPTLAAYASKFIGGFNYENVVFVMIIATIIYIIFCYIFLRIWLKSVFIAALGTLLLIRFLIFGHDPDYFLWSTPSGTPVRYFFDIFFLLFIWLHNVHHRKRDLLIASAFVGLSMSYVTDTGVYQLITLYAYMVLLLIIPYSRSLLCRSDKDVFWIISCILTPFFTAGIFLWFFIGDQLWKPVYWSNVAEYIGNASKGFGAVPMYYNLQHDMFSVFFMACLVVLTYVFTLVRIGSLAFLKKIERENIFAIILCIYGLCTYHYFVYRSIATGYFFFCVPFIFVICYWIKTGLDNIGSRHQKGAMLILILGVSGALFTTHSFIKYPNLLNFTRVSLAREKQIFKTHFINQKDVELISRLTQPDEKVCLIGNMEISTLIEADRKPFFYYFNLVLSNSPRLLKFNGINAYTVKTFTRTFNQIKSNKSRYIFIEKKIFFRRIPREQYRHYQIMTVIVDYLHEKYSVSEEGHYLVALKKNSP